MTPARGGEVPAETETRLPTPAPSTAAIAIICKVPVPGRAKTRLIPRLGAERAAELSRAFLTDLAATVERVGARVGARGYAVCSPAEAAEALSTFLPASFGYAVHTDPVLGRVLDAATADLLGRGHDCAVLVNGDSPTLPEAALEAAVAALRRPGERAVFGPALDGGYTLVGLKRREPRLFADIAWSTPAVMEQSRARAAAAGLAVEEVAPWYDVDDAESLGWLAGELAGLLPAGLAAGLPAELTAGPGPRGAPAPATRAVLRAAGILAA